MELTASCVSTLKDKTKENPPYQRHGWEELAPWVERTLLLEVKPGEWSEPQGRMRSEAGASSVSGGGLPSTPTQQPRTPSLGLYGQVGMEGLDPSLQIEQTP